MAEKIIGPISVYIGYLYYQFGVLPPHFWPLLAGWLVAAVVIALIIEHVLSPAPRMEPALDSSGEVEGSLQALASLDVAALMDKRAAVLLKEQLQDLRKRWALRRREIHQQMSTIRKSYTRTIRYKAPAVPGRTRLARDVRGLQTLDRHDARVHLADLLAPYGIAVAQREDVLNRIDYASLDLDEKIRSLPE
jgi:hypothetical protein